MTRGGGGATCRSEQIRQPALLGFDELMRHDTARIAALAEALSGAGEAGCRSVWDGGAGDR